MEHLMQSLKVFWRSERLIRQQDLQRAIRKCLLLSLAGLVAVCGLIMVNISLFFALDPHFGQAPAALIVGVTDLVIAAILLLVSQLHKSSKELQEVRNIRDIAINDVERQLTRTTDELSSLKGEVMKFLRHPAEVLFAGALGPLLGAVVQGLRSTKKTSDQSPDSEENPRKDESAVSEST